VAQWHVEEHRHDFLLEEAGVEAERQEGGRLEDGASHPLLEVLGEDSPGDVGHFRTPAREARRGGMPALRI
jgi:hypothetical protein